MPDDITMPMIAIGGGFTLLALLVCILIARARGIARRRRALLDTRRTRFHAAVIDPRIADLARAAFEDVPRPVRVEDQPVHVVEIELPPPPPMPVAVPVVDYVRPDMRVQMHYLHRQPRRMARGSAPGIPYAPPAHAYSATTEWDVPTAPSVTARMRAYRR